MASKKSNISKLDDLFRLNEISSQSCMEEFLRFAINQEECRIKWQECLHENGKIKKMLEESQKENNTLNTKLTTARKLLDQEKQKTIKAVEEKINIENQLQMVRDLLFADNRNQIHDETKEKLQFLNGSRSRMTNDYDRLSAIHELDSTGSILSDLSYSRSDDGLDADKYCFQRISKEKRVHNSCGDDNPFPVKRRRSNLKAKAEGDERMVATSKVIMKLDGSLSTQCEIRTIPSVVVTQIWVHGIS